MRDDARYGMLMIERQPLTTQNFFAVIRPLDELRVTDIAGPGDFGRVVNQVVRSTAAGTDAAIRDAADNFLIVHLQDYDSREIKKLLSEHLIKRSRLGHRPGVAIHDKPFGPVLPAKPFGHHLIDEVIRNRLTFRHIRSSYFPDGGLLLIRFAENVPGRDVSEVEPFAQEFRLSAFPASRWTDKDQSHFLSILVVMDQLHTIYITFSLSETFGTTARGRTTSGHEN
jgi:hypothetical protein